MAQTSSVRLAPCDQFRHFCPAFPECSIHLPPSCRVPRFPPYLSAGPVGAGWLLSTGTRHPKAGESLKSSAVVGSSNGTSALSEALLGKTSFQPGFSLVTPHQMTQGWCGYSHCITQATCIHLRSRMVFPLAHELSCECCLLLGGVVRRVSKVGVPSPFPLFPLPATTSHLVGHRAEAAPLLYSLSKTLGAVPATAKQVWTVDFFFFFLISNISKSETAS